MTNLSFHETHRYDFPYTTTGAGTALTACHRLGDPAMAFLTQTGQEDEVVYLSMGYDNERFRHVTPVDRNTISGMGYNPFTRRILCASSTTDKYIVFAFDPDTGLEVNSRDLSADTTFPGFPQGFATNGLFFVRSEGDEMELRLINGNKLGQISFPGRNIQGIAASPWSWTFCDSYNDEIVVIGPLGNEIATSTGVGTSGGMDAITLNTISDMDSQPQVWLESGILGDPGTIHHPDTPWDPEPWLGRHRLFVANYIDQIIYAGYLTEN